MNTIKFLIIFTIIIASVSCEKVNIQNIQADLSAEMPGKHIQDMEIDNNNNLYFVTSETDTSIDIPLWSSYIPSKFYLSRKICESGEFIILDNDFIQADEILFDRNNKLWARNGKEIFLRNGQINQKIIELSSDEGLFQFIAVDNENNIWTGGLQTGLYKIDNKLNITKYNTENSGLPTNSMTNIHIDKNNNIWIALWNNKGILKISKDSWIVYNSNNSNITSQNIWCLVTDKNDNLWIGTGHDNENQSLMRFDGENWETINPRNDKNEIVKGTVRKLYSDINRIYVVSEKVEKMAFSSNELLTFDGINWNKIYDIPEDDAIADLKIDYYRQIVWIRTLNSGIFNIPI
jgi:ligand-binding sensor domain-containing protein